MSRRKAKEFVSGQGYTREDWDVVSDNPEITPEMMRTSKSFEEAFPDLAESVRRRGPQKTPVKVKISIRLSSDVIEAFKAEGPGWQARIDDALRKAARL